MSDHVNLKRPLLYALIGSILLGAILAIVTVLRNTWGWFEVRIILTTIIIAVASLCGLASDLSRTPKGANLLPRIGLALTFLAAGLILLGMWSEIDSVPYWKATVVLSIFAVATVHVCLLSIARLSARFRWVYYITTQVVYGLAILLCVMVLWELDDAEFLRIVAAISIVDAALTLVIPILHRISRADRHGPQLATPLEQRNAAAIDEEIAQLRKRIAELEKIRADIAGAVETSM